MKKDFSAEEVHDAVTSFFKFILAGFEGRTSGVTLESIRLQRCGDDSYRVVLKGYELSSAGNPVRVVAFTSSDTALACLEGAESAYRKNEFRWHIDKYAAGNSVNGSSESESRELVITD